MGSVHKSRNSKYWHGSFWHQGKQVYRSTGQTDKGKALQVVLAWEQAVKGPMDSPEQARRVMADLLSKVLGAGKGRMSCRDYAARWLAEIEATVAPATKSFYKGTLEAWLTWMGERALRPLDAVQREDIVAWRTAEAQRVTARTANNRMKAVRALFKAAVLEGYAAENPTLGLKPVKVARKEKRKRRPFTRGELAKVMVVADETWRLLILAGLQTGQRLGDLVRMEWGELDLGRAVWSVTTGKTGHALRIPLSGELVRSLQERAGAGSNTGPVFPELLQMVERSRGYIGGVSKQFAHLLWQAGLRCHTPYGQGEKKKDDRREQHELSFHSLRHTARTWLEEAGQPKAVIDALIGHEGDTGRIYTTVSEDALRKAAWELAAGWAGGAGA